LAEVIFPEVKMAAAHVLINCNPGFEEFVIDELKKFDFIREAREVYGAFDIVAMLETPNAGELRGNISENIRKIKNIISTITLVHFDEEKIK
jgi:DNA-binding Lrp family transcriptional regulator